MKVLELDQKAQKGMFLLVQSGHVGRTQANKLRWHLLSGPTIDSAYWDLPNLVAHKVYQAKQEFDQPPRQHQYLT